jgi:hypothetical protein
MNMRAFKEVQEERLAFPNTSPRIRSDSTKDSYAHMQASMLNGTEARSRTD